MSETSRLWPYIRAIGKALTIPGTKIGLSILTDIQDQLSADEFQRQVAEALNAIHADTAATLAQLQEEDIQVSAQALTDAALQLAEACYLKRTADEYLYADFKGIEQMEKLVPLKLDEVFVNLKVRPEKATGERHERERELLRRLEEAERADRDKVEQRLADLDVEKIRGLKAEAEPRPIDRVLARPGGVVLLGGPGSGKTTLIKRLARSCALGAEVARQRYPDLPECFPIVVPVAVFDDQRDGRGLFEYLKHRLDQLGGQPLVQVFTDRWAAGQCLLLLDGLDEVADTGRRVGCARAVGDLLQTIGHNRVVISSRPVGYSICRLSVPAEHVLVQPFERGDIETFVHQWHLAYDRAVHPERPDPQRAEADARDLISEIQANDRVESLAANPLMLTIIALIKQQQVTLPERRVELYEIALNTLIRSWNKARSLSGHPVGEALSAEETKKVWGRIAFWMHKTKSTGTCHRQQLQQRLVEVLTEIGKDEIEAERTAESYIHTAAERAGLLEERGANVFAFMHQTFQEYLAARFLAVPHRKVIDRVLEVAPDPRWHEVIRLTAGYIGVIQEDDEMVTDLVTAIANDDRNPLEPYLCTSLRLAASCIADEVRVRQREADAVVVRICERHGASPYERVTDSLYQALKAMRAHAPDGPAVTALAGLTKHTSWQVRMEAARMLSRAAHRNGEALECLRRLFQDDREGDVKAHAAWGLWRAGERQDDAIPKAIAHGLASSHAGMRLDPSPDLVSALLKLLEDEDAVVRYVAAKVVGAWGHQAEALPALLKLLEAEPASVRYRAAEVFGGWGPQAEALPLLLKLLEDESAYVRSRAAQVLGGWGPQAETFPALLKLLEHENPYVRYRAAEVVGDWGHQAEALPALFELLEDEDVDVRLSAAAVLGGWGHQAEALPALLNLLEDQDWSVRSRAVEVLGGWSHQAEALPALLKLVEDEAAGVRFGAAVVLASWGPQAEALPALLKLFEDEAAEVRSGAAAVLFGWDPQVEALPALLKLLKDQAADARVCASAVLVGWGPQAEALPVLLKLLKDEEAYVRSSAADVLGGWGAGWPGARGLLGELIGDDAAAATAYLERAGQGRREQPSTDVARLLARAIEPNDDDSERVKMLREIVFQWVWQASQ